MKSLDVANLVETRRHIDQTFSVFDCFLFIYFFKNCDGQILILPNTIWCKSSDIFIFMHKAQVTKLIQKNPKDNMHHLRHGHCTVNI